MKAVILFSTTLFLSAALLFWVQPMIAKILLPLLGGAPGVWNVCMVFFQALLLAGYGYAHLSGTRLSPAAQGVVHVGLLLVTAIFLPFGISGRALASLPSESDPSYWLLWTLLSMIGLPFFVLSGTAPLLQRWFATTGHASAKDPYFLYSASNLGSLVALFGYPLVIEPSLRVGEQARVWFGLYGGLVVMMGCCLVLMIKARAGRLEGKKDRGRTGGSTERSEDIRWRDRLRWTALAFVPSSLMLGVTSYLTTDIASIPLLWVIPLGLYLLTFVIVFARRRVVPQKVAVRMLPIAAVALMFVVLSRAFDPAWLVISIHLVFFFIACLVCHGRLAEGRPAALHLTEFYLWLSVGGVLGGIVNALVAPVVFDGIVEYPLVVVLTCLAGLVSGVPARRTVVVDFAFALTLGVITVCAAAVVTYWSGLPEGMVSNGVIFGIPAVIVYTFIRRPLRFCLGMGALLVVSAIYTEMRGQTLYAERSFFGVSRVAIDPTGRFVRLMHGNTNHGQQFLEAKRKCEPAAYYHRAGPLGAIFEALDGRLASGSVGVIGLGTGAMCCYAKPGQQWTFYEIDPVVIRIAKDEKIFSFVGECTAVTPRIVLGDGRLRIREAAKGQYRMIVLDAFSSDAIPIHLLTREAMELYVSKLAEGGVLVMHVSNRYLNIEPVIAAVAREMGLAGRYWHDQVGDAKAGKDASQWVVLGRRAEDLGGIGRDRRWRALKGRLETKVWSDDFSDILGVFKWNE